MITDVTRTTDWEERLSLDPISFEKEIEEYITNCVTSPFKRASFEQSSLGSCPVCRKPIYENKVGYGCSGYKDEPKCNFIIFKIISGASVSPEEASLLLIGQKTKVKKCKSKDGKPFEASFALQGDKVTFIFKDKK